jgi:hypothetical protein
VKKGGLPVKSGESREEDTVGVILMALESCEEEVCVVDTSTRSSLRPPGDISPRSSSRTFKRLLREAAMILCQCFSTEDVVLPIFDVPLSGTAATLALLFPLGKVRFITKGA